MSKKDLIVTKDQLTNVQKKLIDAVEKLTLAIYIIGEIASKSTSRLPYPNADKTEKKIIDNLSDYIIKCTTSLVPNDCFENNEVDIFCADSFKISEKFEKAMIEYTRIFITNSHHFSEVEKKGAHDNDEEDETTQSIILEQIIDYQQDGYLEKSINLQKSIISKFTNAATRIVYNNLTEIYKVKRYDGNYCSFDSVELMIDMIEFKRRKCDIFNFNIDKVEKTTVIREQFCPMSICLHLVMVKNMIALFSNIGDVCTITDKFWETIDSVEDYYLAGCLRKIFGYGIGVGKMCLLTNYLLPKVVCNIIVNYFDVSNDEIMASLDELLPVVPLSGVFTLAE